MQRPTWLIPGATPAALLAIAGGTAALIQPGFVRDALTAASLEVFRAISLGVLDKTLPELPAAQETASTRLLGHRCFGKTSLV